VAVQTSIPAQKGIPGALDRDRFQAGRLTNCRTQPPIARRQGERTCQQGGRARPRGAVCPTPRMVAIWIGWSRKGGEAALGGGNELSKLQVEKLSYGRPFGNRDHVNCSLAFASAGVGSGSSGTFRGPTVSARRSPARPESLAFCPRIRSSRSGHSA